MSADLRTTAESYCADPKRKDLGYLHMLWRIERNRSDRERQIPAIGSETTAQDAPESTIDDTNIVQDGPETAEPLAISA